MQEMQIEYWPLERLIPYARNPRKNDQAVEQVVAAIKEFGFRVPVVAKSDGTIVDGHLRLKAAQRLKMETVPVVNADDMTEAQIKAFRISVNRMAELAEWDFDMLKLDMEELKEMDFDLELTGLDGDMVKDLLNAIEGTEGETDPDDIPDAPAEPITRLGDLYSLGRHRLLCGDSTNITDVERLMDGKKADMVFTDPPYGIEIVQGNLVGGGGPTKFGKVGGYVPARTYKKIEGDNTTDTARDSYQVIHAMGIKNIIMWGGNYFTDFLPPSPCWLIWDKENTGNFADVEIAWSSFPKRAKLYKHLWNGLCRKGDHQTEGRTRVHPTQKPVGLFVDIFADFEGQIILDLFLGSGSTLIACEKTGRTCYGMELDTQYCDVIVARWEKFTGKKAELQPHPHPDPPLEREGI